MNGSGMKVGAACVMPRIIDCTRIAYGGESSTQPPPFAFVSSGGGLYRHISISSSGNIHIAADGVFAPAVLFGPYAPNGDGSPAAGLMIATALISPRTSVVNSGSTSASAEVRGPSEGLCRDTRSFAAIVWH
jgi:hypothetical protein